MYLNGKGDGRDEIIKVCLLDLHLLLFRSLPHGGYCAGLIESNTMLSGCFHWQTNFKTCLATYLGCCALALFNSDFLSGCFQSPCAGFLCYFLPFTW